MAEFSYSTYLKVGELLDLQECMSVDPDSGEPEHDETLFIIIHQVYELWFKQMLHELDRVVVHLDSNSVHAAQHQLKRVLKILKTLVGQVDILETMTPAEFASFRSFLANASGFQSAQFRELEFLLGIKDRIQIDWFAGEEAERLDRRFNAPTIWDAFVWMLHRQDRPIPNVVLDRDVRQPVVGNEIVQSTLVEAYGSDVGLAGLCETMTDLDEGLQEWRYRHVMMVRRTIGTKPGTGGSDGAAYLATTLFKPAFPDLWAIRTNF